MKRKSRATGLTEFESHVLALIWRHQPTTAYQVRHAHARSPTLDLALSQGSVYPVIKRLKARGFITTVASNDKRRTEQLSCTASGEDAVKSWLGDLPSHLPDDPLRSRALALSILGKRERASWVKAARECLLRDLAHVEEFAEGNPGPFFDLAHDNARSTLLARIRWLERVESRLETID